MTWVGRPMRDARAGDTIRPAGGGEQDARRVTGRYPDSWRVVQGEKHWDDHVVQPGEVWLCFDGSSTPQHLNPAFPIEILMTSEETAAAEMLGWENRLEVIDF